VAGYTGHCLFILKTGALSEECWEEVVKDSEIDDKNRVTRIVVSFLQVHVFNSRTKSVYEPNEPGTCQSSCE
jgi:hypothetical protein